MDKHGNSSDGRNFFDLPNGWNITRFQFSGVTGNLSSRYAKYQLARSPNCPSPYRHWKKLVFKRHMFTDLCNITNMCLYHTILTWWCIQNIHIPNINTIRAPAPPKHTRKNINHTHNRIYFVLQHCCVTSLFLATIAVKRLMSGWYLLIIILVWRLFKKMLSTLFLFYITSTIILPKRCNS